MIRVAKTLAPNIVEFQERRQRQELGGRIGGYRLTATHDPKEYRAAARACLVTTSPTEMQARDCFGGLPLMSDDETRIPKDPRA